MVKNAIIAKQGTKDSIQVGSKVILEIGPVKERVTIVGSTEADPMEGKISAESPLGKALLNRKEGDKIEVETPGGRLKYTIKEIK